MQHIDLTSIMELIILIGWDEGAQVLRSRSTAEPNDDDTEVLTVGGRLLESDQLNEPAAAASEESMQPSGMRWLYLQRLIPLLVDALSPESASKLVRVWTKFFFRRLTCFFSSQPDRVANASRVLIDLLCKTPMQEANILVTHLMSRTIIRRVVSFLLSNVRSKNFDF